MSRVNRARLLGLTRVRHCLYRVAALFGGRPWECPICRRRMSATEAAPEADGLIFRVDRLTLANGRPGLMPWRRAVCQAEPCRIVAAQRNAETMDDVRRLLSIEGLQL